MSTTPIDDLGEALRAAHPELDAVREAAGESRVYLVGGAVRDLLLGRERVDVDLVVLGDAAGLAARLGAETIEHERFATAKAWLGGHEIDIASARTETYPRPGALPEVVPAGEIEADLARRDFTINAMALPLWRDPDLIDPHRGREDLEAGLLRILHPRSFEDDPTRALRAARYAARFGFGLEPDTAALLRKADLSTISVDRKGAELLRLAAELEAPQGFELLGEWGLVEMRPGGVELAIRVAELLAKPPWRGFARRDISIMRAALGPVDGEEELAAARPLLPSQAVELAGVRPPFELILARALGAEWLDRWLLEWCRVRLEIDGEDLIAAGVPEGPAIGRGLNEAARAKLDGEVSGREQELDLAVAVAMSQSGER